MREKTKIAVRAVKAYISKSILPIVWTVKYIIIIFVPDPQTHGPTCKHTDGHTDGRTDTQKHERTRRRVDGHAEARTQTHGRRRTDAEARKQTHARTQMQAPDGARTLNIRACSAWLEKSSRHVLRLDERTRTFEVYYSYYFQLESNSSA